MKIALITDTHWGVRSDAPIFHDYNKNFLDEVFFPHLEKNNIKTIVHLGDMFDRRKYINFQTANRIREDFLQPISDKGFKFHIIAGNHDIYYRNTNKINAIRELIDGRYNFHIYDDVATEVIFDNTKVLLIPWICDENYEKSMNNIKNTDAQIAFGHLEIQGFEMYKGSIVSHGHDRRIFENFDIVLSGHYHHRSTDGCISYLGCHSEFTWADYDDPKGFHVFDTETRELAFIENPYKMFAKIWYNDAGKTFDEAVLKFDYEQYRNRIVKVIVSNKDNPYWFDNFIERLQHVDPQDLQIVEDHLNLNMEDDENIVNEAEDTLSIFRGFIKQIQSESIDKEQLNVIITELYNEAITLE